MVNMGITKEELIELHPYLFHMAEEGTWESIKNNGLMSTTALLDRFEIDGDLRLGIEERNRRRSVVINHPNHGSAVIRDQIPMTDSALEKCLVDLSPEEWYKLLNSRVFFWSSMGRLSRLFNARAYRDKTQCIITVDTGKLIEKYLDRIALSAINSGSTIYKPQPRGRDTFLPLADFPFEEWTTKRSRSTSIVEVTVDYSVPDLADFVTEVVHMKNGNLVERFL